MVSVRMGKYIINRDEKNPNKALGKQMQLHIKKIIHHNQAYFTDSMMA